MNRQEFGKLIKALRHECLDEHLNYLTQEELAHKTGLGVRTIIRLENGDKAVKLQGSDLLKLADALHLTTGERREFFLAATAVEKEKVALNLYDPLRALDHLLDLMRKLQWPGFILDSYCDVIAVNAGILQLYDLSPTDVRNVTSQSNNFNILRFLFSPDFREQQEMMHEDWKNIVRYNLMNFRAYSLRYRATTYFENLMAELRSYRDFRQYWQQLYLYEEEDHIFDGGHIHLKSKSWGELEYLGTLYTALTIHGLLQLCVYVPISSKTLVEFCRIIEQSDATIYRLSTWPKPLLME